MSERSGSGCEPVKQSVTCGDSRGTLSKISGCARSIGSVSRSVSVWEANHGRYDNEEWLVK
jgi:hypothetical protein